MEILKMSLSDGPFNYIQPYSPLMSANPIGVMLIWHMLFPHEVAPYSSHTPLFQPMSGPPESPCMHDDEILI